MMHRRMVHRPMLGVMMLVMLGMMYGLVHGLVLHLGCHDKAGHCKEYYDRQDEFLHSFQFLW